MIIELLTTDSYIILNKKLIKTIGLNETILLGELCGECYYWMKQNKLENGWFYSTVDNVKYNTSLSDSQQRNAIKKLKDLGIIDYQQKGLPAKRWFKINEEELEKIFL